MKGYYKQLVIGSVSLYNVGAESKMFGLKFSPYMGERTWWGMSLFPSNKIYGYGIELDKFLHYFSITIINTY